MRCVGGPGGGELLTSGARVICHAKTRRGSAKSVARRAARLRAVVYIFLELFVYFIYSFI